MKFSFSTPTFQQKIGAERDGFFVYTMLAKNEEGRDYWMIFGIPGSKRNAFIHALNHTPKGEKMDINDYGKILSSDYGTSVPEEVKTLLAKQYTIEEWL